MDQLLFLGYELSVTLIPFFIVWILSRRRDAASSHLHTSLTIMFAVYLFAVFHVTGAGSLYDGLYYHLEISPDEINLIPFSNQIDIPAYLANILLFIPFGLLAPFVWNGLDHPAAVTCSGFGFSLLIELSQLLNHRATDIDDLILNTLGALIGYALFKVLTKVTASRRNLPSSSGYTLFLYIAAIFLGRFLLYNDMGLAKLLYGF